MSPSGLRRCLPSVPLLPACIGCRWPQLRRLAVAVPVPCGSGASLCVDAAFLWACTVLRPSGSTDFASVVCTVAGSVWGSPTLRSDAPVSLPAGPALGSVHSDRSHRCCLHRFAPSNPGRTRSHSRVACTTGLQRLPPTNRRLGCMHHGVWPRTGIQGFEPTMGAWSNTGFTPLARLAPLLGFPLSKAFTPSTLRRISPVRSLLTVSPSAAHLRPLQSPVQFAPPDVRPCFARAKGAAGLESRGLYRWTSRLAHGANDPDHACAHLGPFVLPEAHFACARVASGQPLLPELLALVQLPAL